MAEIPHNYTFWLQQILCIWVQLWHQHHKVRSRVHKRLRQTNKHGVKVDRVDCAVRVQTKNCGEWQDPGSRRRNKRCWREEKPGRVSACSRWPVARWETPEFGRVSYFVCECKLKHWKKTHHTHKSDDHRDNRLFLYSLLVVERVCHGWCGWHGRRVGERRSILILCVCEWS